jgi:hypothetical protein
LIENVVKPTTLFDSTNQIQPSEKADNQLETATSTTNTEEAAPPAGSTYVPPHLRRKIQEQQNEGNKSTQAAPATATAAITTTETSAKYVPPSLRNKMATGGALNSQPQMVTVGRKSNKSQPNINDNLEFPSLDATMENNSEKMANGNEK